MFKHDVLHSDANLVQRIGRRLFGRRPKESCPAETNVVAIKRQTLTAKAKEDRVLIKRFMMLLTENEKKPQKQRHELKMMVVGMFFTQNIKVPDNVREEIDHFDDVCDIKIDAIRDLLKNVTSVTVVGNNGEYVSQLYTTEYKKDE